MNTTMVAVLLSATCVQAALLSPANAGTTSQRNSDGSTTLASSEQTSNSDANYLYDRMVWDGAVPAWSHDAMMKGAGPDYCIPRYTVVISQAASPTSISKTDASAKTGEDEAAADKKYLPVVVSENHFLNIFGYDKREDAQRHLDSVKDGDPPLCEGVSKPTKLSAGRVIYVEPGEPIRWGWEYGALVVPFKMQLGGKHTFSGSSSVGAYLGYRLPMWDTGIVLSPVAFAGASNISVPTGSGGKNNTQTMAGLSYGLGVIGRVKDGFQVGVIFGKDHVDSNSYQYNDKTWVSLEIGYSFAQ